MNPLALHIAAGTPFFIGLPLALVSVALLLRFQLHAIRSRLTSLAIISAILVAISATPQPVWLYAAWGITLLTGLILGNRTSSSRLTKWAAYTALLATTAALFLAELPFLRKPHLTVRNDATVYVLGDSISAGIGTKVQCWPMILQKTTSLRVVNLAQPAATVESAITQARDITESNACVIVEIGGNDLLGETGSAAFRAQLDTLLSLLHSNHHQILLVELPLFPFQNAIGEAQRNIAAKYGAAILPKRVFARVLGTRNGTLDGLHLSQEGHNAMANSIAEVVEREH